MLLFVFVCFDDDEVEHVCGCHCNLERAQKNPYGHVLLLLKSILLCAVCLAASRDPKVCMRIQRIVKFIGCCGLYLYEHIVIAVLLVML